MNDSHDSHNDSGIHGLLETCVSLIASGISYERYAEILSHLYGPGLDERFAWPVALSVARAVWGQTPNPEFGYDVGKLSQTGRNESCQCGSGRKYKQCCQAMDRDVPIKDVNFLPMLLEYLPRTRWRELAGSRVGIYKVAHAALEMRDQHQLKEVVALLEPWFQGDKDFVGKREDLFDLLLDAYTELDHPRKKARLINRACTAGDRRLRSVALQRKAAIASDRDNYTEAWKYFQEALRHDPDSPSLSHLEVTLLLSQGREAEARERARFWAHRLAAQRDPELDELIGFMRDISARGAAGVADLLVDADPDLNALAEVVGAAPPIESHYALEPDEDSAGPLRPAPALADALRAWHAVASEVGHSPLSMGDEAAEDELADWLPVLRARPVLWNAFEVLDAIVAIVRAEHGETVDATLVRPLLERAEQLLREVLRANQAGDKRLEWGWLENRPALHLIGERLAMDNNRPVTDEHVARLEWLVCTLNPNDNQGFRNMLMRAYLQSGRAEDAVKLAEHYPDDLAAMSYDRALALLAAGQRGAALSALKDAFEAYPKLLQWLLKTKPKPPKLDPWGISVGGDDEAWLYRCEALPLWQKYGAIDWLRKFKASQRRKQA